jgi:membrane protein DedA with SNARE-associated domain
MRLALLVKGALVLALAMHFHLHHHLKGPAVDYGALFAGAVASWIGIPGPGEPLLIAAGIFAARHHLDISSVLAVAWLGATLGGVAGWLIGMRAGRALVTAPGPLFRLRRSAVERGDEVFERYAVVAILLTPSWVAGIHRVRARVYLPTNAFGAVLWAAGIGLGAYYAGPPIVDFVADLGWVTGGALALLVACVVTGAVLQQRRRSRRSAGAS